MTTTFTYRVPAADVTCYPEGLQDEIDFLASEYGLTAHSIPQGEDILFTVTGPAEGIQALRNQVSQ